MALQGDKKVVEVQPRGGGRTRGAGLGLRLGRHDALLPFGFVGGGLGWTRYDLGGHSGNLSYNTIVMYV